MNLSHEVDTMTRELLERARDAFDRVMANRERIVEAFIAETGCLPSEIEQVEVREGDTVRWFLRRREALEAESHGNSSGNRGVNEPGT